MTDRLIVFEAPAMNFLEDFLWAMCMVLSGA
jgi:hypothetical protein